MCSSPRLGRGGGGPSVSSPGRGGRVPLISGTVGVGTFTARDGAVMYEVGVRMSQSWGDCVCVGGRYHCI